MDPFQVNGATPLEVEVEAEVHCFQPLKAGGHNHLRVEHFKQ